MPYYLDFHYKSVSDFHFMCSFAIHSFECLFQIAHLRWVRARISLRLEMARMVNHGDADLVVLNDEDVREVQYRAMRVILFNMASLPFSVFTEDEAAAWQSFFAIEASMGFALTADEWRAAIVPAN